MDSIRTGGVTLDERAAEEQLPRANPLQSALAAARWFGSLAVVQIIGVWGLFIGTAYLVGTLVIAPMIVDASGLRPGLYSLPEDQRDEPVHKPVKAVASKPAVDNSLSITARPVDYKKESPRRKTRRRRARRAESPVPSPSQEENRRTEESNPPDPDSGTIQQPAHPDEGDGGETRQTGDDPMGTNGLS
jgi:hypothetical protein